MRRILPIFHKIVSCKPCHAVKCHASTATLVSLVATSALLLLSLPAPGQERQGPFIMYSWRSGLSAGWNTSVCESPDGFLFIATDNGLIQFDGRRYQRIQAGPGSISDNILTDVAISADGRTLWIGALRRGLSRYDLKTRQFRAYPRLWGHETHVQSVKKILCLPNGQTWLGASGMGMALYIPETDTFSFFKPLHIQASWPVNDMVQDPADPTLIWLVSDREIYRFDIRTHAFTPAPLPEGSDFYWTSIDHDGREVLWLGSWGKGMFSYDTRTRELKSLSSGHKDLEGLVVMDVRQIADTTVLWACGRNGLLAFNPQNGRFRQAIPDVKTDPTADAGVEYLAISTTPHAGVFIGAKGQLLQLHPYYSRLGNIVIPAPWAPQDEIYTGKGIIDSLSGQYLIPCAGPLSLLAVERKRLQAHPVFLPVKGLRDLARLPGGKTVALDFEGGLHYLESGEKEAKLLPIPFSEPIEQMAADGRGFLWILTRQRLFRLDSKTMAQLDSFSFFETKKTFPSLYLYHLETTSSGAAWVGSSQGLWLAEPGTSRLLHFHPENAEGKWLKDKLIKSMAIDERDRLWVGYNGNGLDIFDTRTKRPVEWPQGETMHARQINGLASTPGGYLLALSTEGLIAIDKQSLDWQLAGMEDGLFSQFMDKGLWVAPDGTVFINQGTKINVFHESSLAISQEKMQVNIRSVRVNSEEQDFSQFLGSASYLSLPWSSGNISVSFSAMHWLYPFKTRYRYRLNDGAWVETEEPFAQLNALKPGKYRLELAARGAGGIASHPKTLHIEIRPPFWERAWFLLLCTGMFLSGVFALYRYRLRQMRKQTAVRDAISRNLHDDIGSSLSNIQILTELARRSLEDTGKAETLLGRAGEDMRHISEALSEIVWNVNPKYDDLQFLFSRMKRYAADAFEGLSISYELDFPEEPGRFGMDMEQRRDFYLVFKESLHNLVKYAGASMAKVTVTVARHKIFLEVSDDGKGFSKTETPPGNGLISMQHRAEKWKGRLDIRTAPGQGTTVRLEMPLKQRSTRKGDG